MKLLKDVILLLDSFDTTNIDPFAIETICSEFFSKSAYCKATEHVKPLLSQTKVQLQPF